MIDSRLAGYRNNKAQVLIYGKREMTSLEYELYENDYVNLKSSLGLSEA